MTPRRILLAALLVFALYGYPGYLTPESIDQVSEGRALLTSDWHAPALSQLWNLVEYVIGGPAGLFALIGVGALVGLHATLRPALGDRRAALAAGALLISPPILTTLAVVWRDSVFAALLLAGVGALVQQRRGWGLLALSVGAAMQDAGWLATLPLVLGLYDWGDGMRRLHRVGFAVVPWLGTVLLAGGIERCSVETVTLHDEVQLAAVDIAGTLRAAPPISDAELTARFAKLVVVPTENLQRVASTLGSPHAVLVGPRRLFEAPQTTWGARALVEARDALVRDHRGAFLRHRALRFARNLGLFGADLDPVIDRLPADEIERARSRILARHSPVQAALVRAYAAVMATPLGLPLVYAVVAILALVIALRRRERLALSLLLSGIAYELGAALTTTDYGFRHSHWLVTTTLVASLLLVRRLRLRADDRQLAR